MDELELSKIGGVACAALLAFVGLHEISHAVVSVDTPETPAYVIVVAEEEGDAEEEVISIAAIMASADAVAGTKIFKKCSGCHTVAEGGKVGQGPNLWGVLGREIASDGGFGYSPALAEKKGSVWDWEAMNGFLTKPSAYAKGTKMNFAGLKKDTDRANLMAWLNEQSGAPLPLPTE